MNNDTTFPQHEGDSTHKEDQKQQEERQRQHPASRRQDGYAETQGPDYGDSERRYGRATRDTPAQQGYDPGKSGVQPAHNRPGHRVDAPGRDTGTSWGEDEQMGSSTDTPDRQNPAN